MITAEAKTKERVGSGQELMVDLKASRLHAEANFFFSLFPECMCENFPPVLSLLK